MVRKYTQRKTSMKLKAKFGIKYDDKKPRCGLVFGGFSRALIEVARIGTFGANKYTDNGWKGVDNGYERYTNALYRHLLAESDKEYDEESEMLHAAHAAWNALARLELILRTNENAEE